MSGGIAFERCRHCRGAGFVAAELCPACSGTGVAFVPADVPTARPPRPTDEELDAELAQHAEAGR